MSAETKAAAKRRAFHQAQLSEAPSWRQQLWKLAGWIISEARIATDAGRDRAVKSLTEIALDLNAQNGGTS